MIRFRDVLDFKYRHHYNLSPEGYTWLQIIRKGGVIKRFVNGFEQPHYSY